jgi:hypothetical protein
MTTGARIKNGTHTPAPAQAGGGSDPEADIRRPRAGAAALGRHCERAACRPKQRRVGRNAEGLGVARRGSREAPPFVMRGSEPPRHFGRYRDLWIAHTPGSGTSRRTALPGGTSANVTRRSSPDTSDRSPARPFRLSRQSRAHLSLSAYRPLAGERLTAGRASGWATHPRLPHRLAERSFDRRNPVPSRWCSVSTTGEINRRDLRSLQRARSSTHDLVSSISVGARERFRAAATMPLCASPDCAYACRRQSRRAMGAA